MKYSKKGKINKVLLVPYPAQGHVTPMLHLASALLATAGPHGNLQPVLVVPEFIHRTISTQIDGQRIICKSIPDGLDRESPRDFFTVETAMEKIMPFHLEKLLLHEENDGDDEGGIRVSCVIVDLLASYAINVARRCGVPKVAGFWPAMMATYRLISAIPDMLDAGIISETGSPLLNAPVCVSPGGGGGGQPPVSATELPWLIGPSSARASRFKFWTRTMDRSKSLDCLLVNTSPAEELSTQYPQKMIPIRPTTNDPMISSRIMSTKKTTAALASFWEEDLGCLEWLDKQAAASVIYISFGSWVSPIGETKVKNLAMSLEASGRPFLWALGPACREGLPRGFLDRITKATGKVVSWAPQMEVLQHEAVGCYLTHCGWNSTMEAIQSKKRMLCYPVAGDQFLNCAYIVSVWRVGVRLQGFGKRDLGEGVKRVMEDGEIGERIVRLNERLMGKEATSRAVANLTSFVNHIVSK